MECLGNWKASMVQHDSLNFVELKFWPWCCSALSLSPLHRTFERRLADDQIHQSLPCYCLLLMLLTKTSVNELLLWNKIMCFLVFTSHSSLLLFHLNKNFEHNFAHNTTTWRILWCSFLPNPYINLICFQGYFFGTSKVSTKKIMLIFVQNKCILKIQVIP